MFRRDRWQLLMNKHKESDVIETVWIGQYRLKSSEPYIVSYYTGKYGEGFVGSSRGVAVHVRAVGPEGEKDHTGCKWPLLSSAAPGEPLPTEPWVAVIKRGNCNFEIKVNNAWRANATAVLIYNDRDAPDLEKMKLSTDNGRNISAVFTYKWKGEEITRLADNGTRVMVAIIKGRQTITRITGVNKTSVLFVSISFIVLMVISLAWLVFYYIQRFRYIHAKDRLSVCILLLLYSGFPLVKHLYKNMLHNFHKNCIDPWLLEHRTCPMCKMDILKYYGFVFTGSQESILQLEVEEARSRALSPARNRHPLTLLTSDNSYTAGSERSSRASSPDELVPSLRCEDTRRTDHHSSCTSSPSGGPRAECSRQETASVSSASDGQD
ncbi:Protein goliath [Papilio xuthus]|uniref:Protein goliath n=1 Tax=Papilio xuthus TaxID=66420 RepID=A0A194PXX5_PAPXU|nr:Protein goliath [Papilio xuthus]